MILRDLDRCPPRSRAYAPQILHHPDGHADPLDAMDRDLKPGLCAAVTDFKLNAVDVELGIGHGFTPGSDGLIFKAIIGYAFPVPGKSDEGGSSQSTPLAMGTSTRSPQNAWSMK